MEWKGKTSFTSTGGYRIENFQSWSVLGPYFFENDKGEFVTINSELYGRMITDFFWHNLRVQQQGAIGYPAQDNIALLREKLPGCIISRLGDVNRTPRKV